MHSDETDKEENASHYPYTFVHQEILNVSCNFDHKAVHKDLTNPIVQTQNHSFPPANLFIVVFNTSNR